MFGHFHLVGRRIADGTLRRARGKASSMTDQAIRAAVDQGIRALDVATEQVRLRGSSVEPIELGVTLRMGLVELHMKTIVPAPGPAIPALPVPDESST